VFTLFDSTTGPVMPAASRMLQPHLECCNRIDDCLNDRLFSIVELIIRWKKCRVDHSTPKYCLMNAARSRPPFPSEDRFLFALTDAPQPIHLLFKARINQDVKSVRPVPEVIC
jgi:hypothetical protein